MLYLLDANVRIVASNYYPLDLLPNYWDWLAPQAKSGAVKVPLEIYQEIADRKSDLLSHWIRQVSVKKDLLLEEEVDPNSLKRVLKAYARDLTDVELEKMGADPFLIAYGLNDPNRAIVTKELPKPSRIRANKKIPDICNDLGIIWMDDIKLYRTLKIKF